MFTNERFSSQNCLRECFVKGPSDDFHQSQREATSCWEHLLYLPYSTLHPYEAGLALHSDGRNGSDLIYHVDSHLIFSFCCKAKFIPTGCTLTSPIWCGPCPWYFSRFTFDACNQAQFTAILDSHYRMSQ